MWVADPKVILCFGDSLTWGYNPRNGERYPFRERWTGMLQEELGEEYRIIEEGLCGRTTVWDDPVEGDKNGKKHLGPILESHRPLDLVVIMLGTNDLKKRFNLSPFDIAQGAGFLVDMVRRSAAGRNEGSPEVLLVCPPPLAKLNDFAGLFEGGVEKSKELASSYRIIARFKRCHFLDAGKIVKTSDIDGVHWEVGENRKFALKLASRIRNILG